MLLNMIENDKHDFNFLNSIENKKRQSFTISSAHLNSLSHSFSLKKISWEASLLQLKRFKDPKKVDKKKGTCIKRIGCKKALGCRDMKMKCAERFCVFSNRIERTRSIKHCWVPEQGSKVLVPGTWKEGSYFSKLNHNLLGLLRILLALRSEKYKRKVCFCCNHVRKMKTW